MVPIHLGFVNSTSTAYVLSCIFAGFTPIAGRSAGPITDGSAQTANDELSLSEIAKEDAKANRLLMKLLKTISRNKSTFFGLRPVY